MRFFKLFVVSFAMMLALVAYANPGTVTVTSYPTIALADNQSTVNITAEVRDSSGRLVPDGTEVVFGTNLGTLRDTVVQTRSGYARTVLIAGAEPGIARITASVLSFQTNSYMDFEFVKDKVLLSNLKDFIEVYSPKKIRYVPDLKVMEASARDHGVKIEFRDLVIEADSMQLRVPTYELKAKNVRLKLYGQTLDFQELYLVMNRKEGFAIGVGDEPYHEYVPAFPYGSFITKTRRRNMILQITGAKVAPPKSAIAGSTFDWEDLSFGASEILCKHAVIYPARDIYFQKADIEVQGKRMMAVQFYRLPVYADIPVLGDQVVSMTGSQVSLNYPYYLSLQPGYNSLLRFRTGTAYQGGGGIGGGAFMDYEMNWSKGSQSDGGITFTSLARRDWGVAAHQFLRLDDKSSINVQAQLPTTDSFFTGAQYSRQLGSLSLNYSGNYSKTLHGLRYDSTFQSLDLENLPIAIKHTPFQFSYGLTAQQNVYHSVGFSGDQQLVGLRTRINSNAIPLSPTSNLQTGLTLTERAGNSQNSSGLAIQGNLSYNTRLGKHASGYLHYDYLNDNFVSRDTGVHRLSGSFNFSQGALDLSLFGSKSIDVNRHNVTTNLSYRVSPLWHFSSYWSEDAYLASRFDEATYIFGYLIGGAREIGISYSTRTKRLGLEVFGASF